jgi:hypothetical protein
VNRNTDNDRFHSLCPPPPEITVARSFDVDKSEHVAPKSHSPVSFTTCLRKTQLHAKPSGSRCCYVFRVSTSMSFARCLKKWSRRGGLPATNPIVPRVVHGLNLLSSKKSEECDLDRKGTFFRRWLPMRQSVSAVIVRRNPVTPSLPSSGQSPRQRQGGHFAKTHSPPLAFGRRRSQRPRQRVPVALRPATRRAHSRQF